MNNEYVTLYSDIAKELVIMAESLIKEDVAVYTHYLEGTILYIELTNGQVLEVNIKEYIDDLGNVRVEAINNMKILLENQELIFEYDDSVLPVEFSRDGNDLIVDNNDETLDFNINENKELEALY